MFRSIFMITILPCAVLNLAVSIPSNVDEKKDRGIHKDLSDKEHYGSAGEHNRDYDHEAFLGEQAKDFDNLTPEESIRRLGVIVDKMDKDKDGSVTLEELKEWILYTQNRYLVNDIESQWRNYDKGANGTLTWEDYRLTIYGIRSEKEVGELESQQGFSYKKMLARDKRRWKMADSDNDGELSRDEFAAFLHPENVDHMRDVVILETMEDIDKDSDGKITLEEYISDVYSSGVSPDDEPDWVQTEREQFKLYRDKNGDGVMDEEEVRDWLLPPDFDHAESEARHLLYEADSDSDEKLTKEEILEKYDIFVGSQATDFGEALTRHDEF